MIILVTIHHDKIYVIRLLYFITETFLKIIYNICVYTLRIIYFLSLNYTDINITASV